MKEGLDEDDTPGPAVQEIEVLVGNACDEGEEGFTSAEKDSEWR